MPPVCGERNGNHVDEVRRARRRRFKLRRLRSMKRLDSDVGDDDYLFLDNLIFNCYDFKTKKKDRKQEFHCSMHSSSSSSEINIIAPIEISDPSDGEESYGSVSVCGRKTKMEDAVRVELGLLSSEIERYDFFAVYDGHGGSRVAEACRDRLHRMVAEEIGGGGGGEKVEVDWEKVLCACFSRMDDEINGGADEEKCGSGSMNTVGSTAVVAVVGDEKLVVANCGDSRAVLSRGGVAVPLSRDHKPNRPDEMDRVEAAGGRVINWNGYRVLGVLATSRSIGDYYLKPYVIPIPEVTISERTKNDEFLILASDGLWDVISNEVACQVVRRCLYGKLIRRHPRNANGNVAAETAAVLVELAMARGSNDNISVIVVDLKKSSEFYS